MRLCAQVVLIHGFFTGSPKGVKWRLMYGLAVERGLLTAQEAASPAFAHPKFDPHVRLAMVVRSCV